MAKGQRAAAALAAAPIDTGDITVTIVEDEGESVRRDPETGAIEIDQPDGGVIVKLNPGHDDSGPAGAPEELSKFYRNLAESMESSSLSLIADDLMQAVDADDQSRAQSLADRSRGLDLLGLKLQEPKTTAGDSSTSEDGMSTVTNPLLLELCLKGWANAHAELLPASGPVKVDNVSPSETEFDDELAESYEQGFNYYMTVTEKSYGPDTSHMLLWGTYFGGSGFKKVYRDPLKRRPVSKSVDAKDLIVSDTTKDFSECERITHQIPMRPSVMKRMQMRKVYLDVPLSQPTPQPNAVDQKIATIQGTSPSANSRPEDQPFTLWEIQCELVLDEFAPPDFRGRGIALPYLVTIEKDSRIILQVRRDWKPEDADCNRKQMYVRYPYVPGPGFYGTGMLNIVGNSSAALTAAWRETLDAGMYANFPGGVIAKLGTRQNTSNMRPSPGEFVPIETNDMPIKDVLMGLPYKDVTPGLLKLMEMITAQSKEVGSAPEVPVGEGVANTPVGTMLAHIEQATKIMAAAHKGMHAAQSEEIQLFADLFREEPESFWTGNKKAKRGYWDAQKLFLALETVTLVPKSDPNVPSHVHRMMKAVALIQLLAVPAFATLLDPREVLQRVLTAMKEDPNGLVTPLPPPGPKTPSPEEITAQAKMIDANAKMAGVAIEEKKIEAGLVKEQNDTVQQQTKIAGDAAIKQMEFATEELKAGNETASQQQHQQNEDRNFILAANEQAMTASRDLRKHSVDAYKATNPPKRSDPAPGTPKRKPKK